MKNKHVGLSKHKHTALPSAQIEREQLEPISLLINVNAGQSHQPSSARVRAHDRVQIPAH